MSINTIILSKGDLLPDKMKDFLDEARFFTVNGKFESLSEATESLESQNEKIDYLFLDLENNAADLPYFSAEKFPELRILLFSSNSVFMVDRAKGDVISSLINFEMNRNSPLHSSYQKTSVGADADDYWEDDNPSNSFQDLPPQSDQNSLFVKSSNKIVRIPLEDLHFVESQKDYLFFHTTDLNVKVLARMKHIANRLDENKFIRIHRSYLVRIDRISTIEGELVYLKDIPKPLPIGPSYKSRLIEVLHLV